MLFESNSLSKIQGSFIFIDINHGLCQPCYSLTIWPKISRAFCFCASCRSDRVLSMLFNSCLDALAHSVTEMVGFSFLSSNVLKFDKLLLSFKWQQFCNEKARTWFGLYGFPSYPLSSVYFQRSSILRRKKKKKEVAVCHRSESTVLDEQLLFLFSRCCHRDYLLVNWSAMVKVFRCVGPRGPRSDLVLEPWSWVG